MEMLKVKIVKDKVIINKESFEDFVECLTSSIETLEILSDKKMIEQIKKSEQDIKEGNVSTIKNENDLKMLLGIKNV